tara:strand:+ start:1763 stop:2137 length:375 start_codon:yes stop_codon:yes gene_type:complete
MDVIPSFKDLDTTIKLFEKFHKDMAKLDISVDMSYDEFCDTWINSGYLGDMYEYTMLPDEPCRSVGADNVVILLTAESYSLEAALGGNVSYSETFEPLEPEVDYCKETDSVALWDEYEGDESPY